MLTFVCMSNSIENGHSTLTACNGRRGSSWSLVWPLPCQPKQAWASKSQLSACTGAGAPTHIGHFSGYEQKPTESNLVDKTAGCCLLKFTDRYSADSLAVPGVLFNPLVPDWLLVVLLTVVLLLLATRVISKGLRMHAAETELLRSILDDSSSKPETSTPRQVSCGPQTDHGCQPCSCHPA